MKTSKRRSGREGQPNGKCKCRWGFQENGQWGKVYKTCGKPVDFHMDGTRKVWHMTCLKCRTEQAKHFGTTLKTAKVTKTACLPGFKVTKTAKVTKTVGKLEALKVLQAEMARLKDQLSKLTGPTFKGPVGVRT